MATETAAQQPKTPLIKQNLDTNFLKLIAIITMAIDHFSKVFAPGDMALAMLGRIAFPLFAYCLVVGCLYTSNARKYILRLLLFAAISQPFYVLGFHPTWAGFKENFTIYNLNIFFTLVAGVLVVRGLMEIKKHWWMIPIALAMELLLGLDYGLYGITMMVIFYLCRNKSWLSLPLVFLWMCTDSLGDFIQIGPLGLGRQAFAVLALPFIYLHTNLHPKIPKMFFYVFYPAHFLLLWVLRLIFKV